MKTRKRSISRKYEWLFGEIFSYRYILPYQSAKEFDADGKIRRLGGGGAVRFSIQKRTHRSGDRSRIRRLIRESEKIKIEWNRARWPVRSCPSAVTMHTGRLGFHRRLSRKYKWCRDSVMAVPATVHPRKSAPATKFFAQVPPSVRYLSRLYCFAVPPSRFSPFSFFLMCQQQ